MRYLAIRDILFGNTMVKPAEVSSDKVIYVAKAMCISMYGSEYYSDEMLENEWIIDAAKAAIDAMRENPE